MSDEKPTEIKYSKVARPINPLPELSKEEADALQKSIGDTIRNGIERFWVLESLGYHLLPLDEMLPDHWIGSKPPPADEE